MNPFTPNFGQLPMYLAGRRNEISDIEYVLEGGLNAPARTSIFIGARGCGKTALLTYFATEAQQRGWICANTACIAGMQEDILQQTITAAENLVPSESGRHIKGLSIGQVFGIEWESEKEYRPNWRTSITRVIEALNEQGIGLLITIDEINPDLEEMIQVASVYQLLIRENRKVALLMAGLPSKVSALLSGESVSFLRRSSQYSLGNIADYDVEHAIRKTVEDSGKRIDENALTLAAKEIAGYPYMLQLVGFHAWNEAEGRDEIDAEDVRRGAGYAKREFADRILKTTLRELSAGDIEFLQAMLPDDDVSRTGDIAKRLGKTSGYVSQYRSRLIESGIIESAGRGMVVTTLPGLKEYLENSY